MIQMGNWVKILANLRMENNMPLTDLKQDVLKLEFTHLCASTVVKKKISLKINPFIYHLTAFVN